MRRRTRRSRTRGARRRRRGRRPSRPACCGPLALRCALLADCRPSRCSCVHVQQACAKGAAAGTRARGRRAANRRPAGQPPLEPTTWLISLPQAKADGADALAAVGEGGFSPEEFELLQELGTVSIQQVGGWADGPGGAGGQLRGVRRAPGQRPLVARRPAALLASFVRGVLVARLPHALRTPAAPPCPSVHRLGRPGGLAAAGAARAQRAHRRHRLHRLVLQRHALPGGCCSASADASAAVWTAGVLNRPMRSCCPPAWQGPVVWLVEEPLPALAPVCGSLDCSTGPPLPAPLRSAQDPVVCLVKEYLPGAKAVACNELQARARRRPAGSGGRLRCSWRAGPAGAGCCASAGRASAAAGTLSAAAASF